MLEEGYIISFTKALAVYEEPNNASANKDPVFVHQAETELATLGIIQFTKEKSHCVSPLTVSHKKGRDGSINKRMCWGGSRCVILKIEKNHSLQFEFIPRISNETLFQFKNNPFQLILNA